MQRMWRQLFAAVLGVVALSGVASAQNPAPAASYRMEFPQAMPAPAPAKAVANQITPVSGAIYVRGSGGCSSCGTAVAAPAASTHGAFAQYGPRDRNGCGSACADAKFIFGSCKSFFDPCGSAGCGGCASCPSWPLAKPYGYKYQGCVYDTYLNH